MSTHDPDKPKKNRKSSKPEMINTAVRLFKDQTTRMKRFSEGLYRGRKSPSEILRQALDKELEYLEILEEQEKAKRRPPRD